MTATTTTAKKRTSRAKASAAPKEELNIELPANPFMFEILNLFNSPLLIGREEKKVEILKKYEDLSLKAIFIWNFDDSLITALPSGDIPYADTLKQTSFSGTVTDKIDLATSFMGELNSNSLGTSSEVSQPRTSIRKEYPKFYNFIKGGNDTLSSLRRETMFINILEGLHPLEAEILALVKDKKLQVKYSITKELVSQAYPDIKWGNR